MNSIKTLQAIVVDFGKRRGWPNDPKNLAMSVAIEAAEIMEHYQWTTTGDGLTPGELYDLSSECADVFWYLLRLCEAEGIDLAGAIRTKAYINEGRFPPETAG